MQKFNFTIKTKENAVDFDEQIFAAGMDDANPTGAGIMFTREAETLPAAVKSALADVAKVKGLTVASIEIDAEDLEALTRYAPA